MRKGRCRMLTRYHSPMDHFGTPTNSRGTQKASGRTRESAPQIQTCLVPSIMPVPLFLPVQRGRRAPSRATSAREVRAPGKVGAASEPRITSIEKTIVVRWADFTDREPQCPTRIQSVRFEVPREYLATNRVTWALHARNGGVKPRR